MVNRLTTVIVVISSMILMSIRFCTADLTAAAVLDESEKCAQASDLWSCMRRGGAKIVGSMLEYRGEIPLMGQYLALVPDRGPLSQEDGRASSDRGNGTGSSSSWSSVPSVYSKLLDFAERRSVRMSLPMSFVTWLVGATSSEGRGKKDKGAGALMLGGMMMMTTLASTAFGALALMAAKGLMTSILALMLSAMAVAKKGGHGHARTTYEVINGLPGYNQATEMLENAPVSDVSYEKQK